MKIKIKKIEKCGKRLILYAKKPLFIKWFTFLSDIAFYFKDEDNFLEVGIDETGKYAILTFVLINKEDILPYIKYDNKEIYERLNEIQYLLKFTYSKKKIRRKVKEVMDLIKKEVE